MAGEDVVIKIGVDISAAKSEIERIEALLKNRSAFGKESYKLGIDHKTFRAQLNKELSDARKLVEQTPLPLELTVKDTSSLPRTRYALYDIANALQNVSATAYNSLSTVVKVAADYETAFTRVEQTTGANAQQAAILRKQLEQLASQIPMTFQDLSGIASLGAQMGVAQADIQAFTKNIAEFSAITGVTAENSAKSFGTIGELLGITADEYANLGSAIAKAGVESVATEAEILSVSTQIAGVASASGLSAQYVVGLSTALASLKVPAEQSRGALTRVFQTINRAATDGGVALQNFATVLGVSVEEARMLSQQDVGTFMDKFIAGLTRISQEAGPQGLTGTLDQLGLSELRVTNTLTRLAQAPNLLAQSMRNSNQAFAEGTFLSEQYAKKVDDIASQFQILQNNFNNLMATIGAIATGPLKFAIDAINNFILGFNAIANSPAGPWIVGIGVGLVALVGIISSVVAGLGLMFAGIFAVRTALSGLAKDTTFANSKLAQFMMGLFGVAVAEGAATVGARVLAVAIKAIPFVGIAAIIVGLATELIGVAQAAGGASVDIGALEKAQKDATAAAKKQNEALLEAQNGLSDTGTAAAGAAEKIRTLTDYANDLSSVFSRAFDIRFSGQQTLDNITKSFSNIAKSSADARQEITGLTADIADLTADKALQEYFLSVAEAYGDSIAAAQIRAKLAKIDSDLVAKNNQLAAAQNKVNKTLVGNSDAAIENRSDILGLVKGYQEHIKALAASGMKQDELSKKTAELKADFIAQAMQLGYNSDELGIYTAAFDDVSIAIDNIPRDVTVDFNGNPALTAINEFVAEANSRLSGVGGGGITPSFNIPTIPEPSDGKGSENKASNWLADYYAGFDDFYNWYIKKWQDMIAFITNMVSQAGTNVWNWFMTTPAGIAFDFVKRLFDALVSDLSVPMQRIQEYWHENFGKPAMAILYGIAGLWKTRVEDPINVGIAAIGALWKVRVADPFNETISGFSNGFNNAFNTISGAFNNLINGFRNKLNEFMQGMRGSMPATFEVIRPVINWAFGTQFADGGYTGTGSKYQVAGIVHKGEYVVPKEQVNQVTGLPYYMTQPRMFAQGGYTGQSQMTMVSLSPEDRALLRSVGGSGEVVLYANNVELARSVNDGNRTIVAQGGRP